MSGKRFAKGDLVRVVNPDTAFFGGTLTVVEVIGDEADKFDYWLRVGESFADIVPFMDEELERAV